MNQDYHYKVKLALIGDGPVGKSSLARRFTDNTFNNHYIETVGTDLLSKKYDSFGSTTKITLFDNATRYIKDFRFQYTCKGMHGFIFIYDIANRRSFDYLNWRLQVIVKYSAFKAVGILVGNKSDLQGSRQVTIQEGEDLADSFGMKFLETSAKDAVNVEKVFTQICNQAKSKGIVQIMEKNI